MGKGGRPYKVHEDLADLGSVVEQEDDTAVKTIVQKHGIDAYDGDKRTVLIWAAFFKKAELLKWLIGNGANVNHQDKSGYTGLHFCGQEKNFDEAKILLENGGDPNIKEEHGNSPLWTALFNAKGNFELVKLLRAHDADPLAKNQHGRSPNDMATTIYKKDIDELIRQGD
jgi:uncharacterized protein